MASGFSSVLLSVFSGLSFSLSAFWFLDSVAIKAHFVLFNSPTIYLSSTYSSSHWSNWMEAQKLLTGYETFWFNTYDSIWGTLTNNKICLFLCSYYRCCTDVKANTTRQHYGENSVGVDRMYTSKQILHLVCSPPAVTVGSKYPQKNISKPASVHSDRWELKEKLPQMTLDYLFLTVTGQTKAEVSHISARCFQQLQLSLTSEHEVFGLSQNPLSSYQLLKWGRDCFLFEG